MPIRVNLKELFPADSQEISVDKINFNFNKLLELGIGEQGLIGLTGPLGSAGPTGVQGEDGVRGSQWYVDSATDPNTLTFQDLLAGDLYLDSTNLSIWQWTGSTWTFVVDLTAVINNYLLATPSPFIRGLGIGPDSNKDQRFILFNRRGNTNLDIVNDNLPGGAGSNASNNDILFLNNFNEDTLEALLQSQFPPGFEFGPALLPVGNQIPSASLFNSLLSVQLDHTISPLGRYHLDMGVLYESDPLDPDSEPKLTTVFENFKMRYLRVGSSVHPGQDHYNLSLFTLDIPEVSIPAIHRVTNGVFKFETPKFLPTIDNERSNFYIGSKYGLDEIVGTSGIIETDGALFVDEVPTIYTNIGITKYYTIPNLPLNTGYVNNPSLSKNYFMLDGSSDIDSIYLNKETYQDGGNLIQLGTGPLRIKAQSHSIQFNSPYDWDQFVGHMAICTDGCQIYTFSGRKNIPTTPASILQSTFGYYNAFRLRDSNLPLNVKSLKFSGRSGGIGALPACTDALFSSGTNAPVGPGVSDMVVNGEIAYVVNSQISSIPNSNSGGFSQIFNRTYFQVLNLKSGPQENFPVRIARLGGSPSNDDPQELIGAYRVALKGRHAIVATNALHQNSRTSFLGYGASPLSPTNLEYIGGLTAVDISEPSDPKIVTSLPHTNWTLAGSNRRAAIMDFEIVGDTAVALVWEQTVANGPFDPCDINIRVNVYNIEKLQDLTAPGILSLGKADTSMLASTGVGFASYSLIFKNGAIAVDNSMIYAGYKDQIRAYQLDTPVGFGSSPDCSNQYRQIGAPFTLSGIPIGPTAGITDMKVIGNSLWVLATINDSSKVYKFNIRDLTSASATSPEVISLVSETEITSPASRFIVVGKHIYLATHNLINSDTADNPALIALDFDGIYSSGAHIESIRTEHLNVTGNAQVSNHLQVQGDSNIGGDLEVNGKLSSNQIQTDRLYSRTGIKLLGQVGPNSGTWLIDLDNANFQDRLSWLNPLIPNGNGLPDSSSSVNYINGINSLFTSNSSSRVGVNADGINNPVFFPATQYDRTIWITSETDTPTIITENILFEVWIRRRTGPPSSQQAFRILLNYNQRWNSTQQFQVPAGFVWAVKIQRQSTGATTGVVWNATYRESIYGDNI